MKHHKIIEYEKLVEKNNVEAMYELAECYKFGKYVDRDIKLAEKYYLMAFNKGHIESGNDLGFLYQQEKKYEKAIEYYHKIADLDYGNENIRHISSSCQYLARLYEKGRGTNIDNNKAFYYYQKANYRNRYDNNLYLLGRCYEKGIGVDIGLNMAIYYYKLADDEGNKKAKMRLDLLEPNYYLKPEELAKKYEDEKDYIKSLKFYKLINDQNKIDAICKKLVESL